MSEKAGLGGWPVAAAAAVTVAVIAGVVVYYPRATVQDAVEGSASAPATSSAPATGSATPPASETPAASAPAAAEASRSGTPEADTPAPGVTAEAPDAPAPPQAEGATPDPAASAGAEAAEASDPLPGPPRFDVVRVEADGSALVAGTAEPEWEIAVELDGAELARERANADGGFVAFLTLGLADRPQVLTLAMYGPEGQGPVASADRVILAPRAPVAAAAAPAPEAAPVGAPGARPGQAEAAAPPPEPAPGTTGETVAAAPDSPETRRPEAAMSAGIETAEAPEVAAAVEAPIAASEAGAGGDRSATASPPEDTPAAAAVDADRRAPERPAATPAPSGAAPAEPPAARPAEAVARAATDPAPAPGGAPAPEAPAAATPGPAPEAPAAARPADAPATPAEPAAPKVILAGEAGARLLQDPDAPPEAMDEVAIDTISYTEAGEVELAGRGRPEGVVRIYLDNRLVTDSRIARDGTWRTELPEVDTGVYALRVDELDADGSVRSRAETPFEREDEADVRSALLAQMRNGVMQVTVQPGFTLWAIARENYGTGVQYVQVFEANRDRIRDPDLIYPGQIFEVPGAASE